MEFEQGGKDRADYGEELLQRLSDDLAARFGRVFPDRTCSDSGIFTSVTPRKDLLDTIGQIGAYGTG